MIAEPLAASLNHLLRGASWARQRLAPFAGQTVHLEVASFGVALSISTEGDLDPAPLGTRADVGIHLSPLLLARILARDEQAMREAQVFGDPALAAELEYVFRHLRWDVEEDLSRVFGDVLAHRIAGAGRSIVGWHKKSAAKLAETLAEYWTEEQSLIARAEDVEGFLRSVGELRDDVERLEKRVNLLDAANAG